MRKIIEIIFQILTVGLLPLWKITEIIAELFQRPIDRTNIEVADIIERHLKGIENNFEWGDYLSIPIKNPELNVIRIRCRKLLDEYPPKSEGRFTDERGEEILRFYINQLRGGLTSGSS
jgi:hypothetical protein